MLGESIFVGILGLFLGTSASFLLRIHNMADLIRDDFMARQFAKSPKTIRDIEAKPEVRLPVRWYYVEAEKLHGWFANGFVFCAAIGLMALVPFTIKPSECIPEAALLCIQVGTILIAAAWMIACMYRYGRVARKRRDYLPTLP